LANALEPENSTLLGAETLRAGGKAITIAAAVRKQK
jgi:hypothetical protein